MKPAVALVASLVIMGIVTACGRSDQADLTAAEATDLARQPIHVQQDLGSDLTLVGLSVVPRPANVWEITLSSRVQRVAPSQGTVWLHAYPVDGGEYLGLASTTTNDDPMRGGGVFPPNQPGHIVKHGFLLTTSGVFNLFAGQTEPDGSLGPAVPLGWIALGVPTRPEFRAVFDRLKTKNADRAVALERWLREVGP